MKSLHERRMIISASHEHWEFCFRMHMYDDVAAYADHYKSLI